MVNFDVFSRFNGFFNRLNPLNSFDFGKMETKKVVSPTSDELLETAIINYADFDKVILLSIYHFINIQNAQNEYLTVLTKDNKLIADLIEGKLSTVGVPEIVQVESEKNNILITCHNHLTGSIIPSKNDFYNVINPDVLFTIIVSKENVGILVNDSSNRNPQIKKMLCNEWEDYRRYISWCFLMEHEDDIDFFKKKD